MNETEQDRGAALVEYAMLVALIAVVVIVSINFLGAKLGDTFAQTSTEVGNTSALAASGTTGSSGSSGSSGSGSSGSGAVVTTTTTAATTTTTTAATTTTTTAATTTTTTAATTTTVAPTTTTTTVSASGSGSGSGQGTTPDQSKTASYDGEFEVTFGSFGDTISITGVDAGDWTYEIVKNVDKKLKVRFTSADGDEVVLVEAKIKKGKLKTKVKTLK